MRLNRAIFLDLNGTLVLPLKQKALGELKILSGADMAVRRLLDSGFICAVISVQLATARKMLKQHSASGVLAAL